MIALAFTLAALLVTAIHELGHLMAARLLRARVAGVRIGYGPEVARFRRGQTEYVIGVLPFGGRMRCDRLRSEIGNAAIALGGPAANLGFAFGLLVATAAVVGVQAMPRGSFGGGALAYGFATVAYWTGIVPRLATAWLGSTRSGGITALNSLLDVATGPGWAGKLYCLAALSSLWGALNLVPLPVVNSDGWHVAAAGCRAARRGAASPETNRAPESAPGDD